jgi:uncharacterized protein
MAVTAPAIYVGHTVHVREQPFLRVFRHPLYLWLVDLDELPSPPRWLRAFAGFRSADHLGDPDLPLRAGLDGWLAARGIDLAGGKVSMLASARVLGHVFNPLSVFWCHRPDGELACVIAEVHNTYGGRHAYLLPARADGAAAADKRFYVSPFFEVQGRYRMRLPEPGEHLDLSITLFDHGSPLFSAALHATRRPADTRSILRTVLAMPLMTQRISLAIRRHGIALWLRGLPVVPRTLHEGSEPKP